MRAIAAGMMVAVLMAAGGAGAAERKVLVIGGGEVTGYYFPAAGSICRVANKEWAGNAACAVLPSAGSAANLQALRTGEVDLALVQSRAAMQAAGGDFPELRALMSLHGEAAIVVVRKDAGIEQLTDLKGKRVNLGRSGSFQRMMGEALLEAGGVSSGDLKPLVELDLAEQGLELCDGTIDAAVFTGVHPMPEVSQAIEGCDARIVPVKARTLEAYFKRFPWLAALNLRGGTYPGVKEDVASLGPKAVLATTTRLSVDDARAVLRAVHANWGAFVRLHPVLKGLGKGETARDAIALRLHDGAERFYQESGIR